MPLRVIGLTGSIGMGKSTVAKVFSRLGIQVHDADAVVHALYEPGGGAVESIRQSFPDAVVNGRVCRKTLAGLLSSNSDMQHLQAIVHPLVARERSRFLSAEAANGSWLCVLDVPLLLEGSQKNSHPPPGIDHVVVVTASAATQRMRCLKRPGMTPEKFEAILGRQMSDKKKVKLADDVINTDYSGFGEARAQVSDILRRLVNDHFRPDFRGWLSSEIHAPLKCVTFDLDDTLYPVRPPIVRAQQSFLAHLAACMPEVRAMLLKLEGKWALKNEMARILSV